MAGAERAGSGLRYGLVFALPFVVTLPRFCNTFVFDDVFLIESDFIFDLSNLPRTFANRAMIASSLDKAVGRPGMDTYRPLSVASFFWDAALSARDTWSYHLTNALLHGGACLLLCALLDRLFPALAARYRTALALWFGLAPWLAEAHVFINGRSDPLLVIFMLAALLAMHAALARDRPKLRYLSALSLFGALLCKEVAVVLAPLLAAVPVAGAPLDSVAALRERARKASPLLIALGLYLAARYYALSGLRSHSDRAQLALALKQLPVVIWDGLYRTALPSPYFFRNMRDDYAALPGWMFALAWLALLALLALLVFALLRRPRASRAVFGLCFALAALAPVAMISTSLWPGFGRYLYAPAVGLCVALAAALEQASERRRLLFPALVAGCLLSGAFLIDATLGYRDEWTLYRRSIAERPTQAWTHGFMGLALRRAQRCPEATAYLNRAATLDPDEARYALRLGQCLLETGAPDAAAALAARGRARFRGRRPEAGFLLLAARCLPSGHEAEQRALLERCLAVDPGRDDCEAMRAQLSSVR